MHSVQVCQFDYHASGISWKEASPTDWHCKLSPLLQKWDCRAGFPRKVHILTQEHTARHMRLFRAVIRGLWSCCSACLCLFSRPRSLYTTWPRGGLQKGSWVSVFDMFNQFDRWCKCNCLDSIPMQRASIKCWMNRRMFRYLCLPCLARPVLSILNNATEE